MLNTVLYLQIDPVLKLTSPPILHLPLAFPATSAHPLTPWCTLSHHLPSLLPHFTSHSLLHAYNTVNDAASDDEDGEEPHTVTAPAGSLPGSKFSHVSYVKVYATCRLRRIWFSEMGAGQRLPWEFQLYAADK
jgi:hypothetical protein